MGIIFLLLSVLSFGCNSQEINAVPSPGCGGTEPAGGTFPITWAGSGSDGLSRLYIVHKPTNYNQNTPIPLIFAFHGYRGTAQGMKNGWNGDGNSNSENYLSVYVQSTSFQSGFQTINSWNDIGCMGSPGTAGPTCNSATVQSVPVGPGCYQDPSECNWCNCNADDVGFIDYLSELLENNYCIDMSREYALGYSQGGMMTHTLGCELNGRFAAIAPFHGQEQIGFNCDNGFDTVYEIGLFNVWGTSDTVVPGEGQPAGGNSEGVESYDGYWYTQVDFVQQRFGGHNGCNTNTSPVTINTQSDGINGWRCTGYNSGCTNDVYVMECRWNGGHSYPTQGNSNYGLAAAVDYFFTFQHPKYAHLFNNMTSNL